MYWRNFIKNCRVLNLVQLELRSMIKGNGMYSVNGVYHINDSALEALQSTEPLLKYTTNSSTEEDNSIHLSRQGHSGQSSREVKKKKACKGK